MEAVTRKLRSGSHRTHWRIGKWLEYGAPELYGQFVVGLLRASRSELVLDDGAGNGRFALQLASLGCEVVALDVSLTLLGSARERIAGHNRVHIIVADMTRLPFASEAFDKVICVHNLWYVADYKNAVQEMRRVLRPGGVFVMDHLNLLDPRTLFLLPYVLLRTMVLGGPVDVGRTISALLASLEHTTVHVYSVVTNDPLRIADGPKALARRFVFKCTVISSRKVQQRYGDVGAIREDCNLGLGT